LRFVSEGERLSKPWVDVVVDQGELFPLKLDDAGRYVRQIFVRRASTCYDSRRESLCFSLSIPRLTRFRSFMSAPFVMGGSSGPKPSVFTDLFALAPGARLSGSMPGAQDLSCFPFSRRSLPATFSSGRLFLSFRCVVPGSELNAVRFLLTKLFFYYRRRAF